MMQLAHLVATRSTCNRKHVGAVVVRDKRVLATGYNGSVPGMPHCDDVDHDMVNGSCVRTIHAEANAITQAARFGISLEGASIYINTFPCWNCFRLIVGVGIKEVYYDDEYRTDQRVLDCAHHCQIRLIGPEIWKGVAGEPL